ncbi:MAG: hypothetical protein RRX92_01475 [Lachnospiraceae bacterium]
MKKNRKNIEKQDLILYEDNTYEEEVYEEYEPKESRFLNRLNGKLVKITGLVIMAILIVSVPTTLVIRESVHDKRGGDQAVDAGMIVQEEIENVRKEMKEMLGNNILLDEYEQSLLLQDTMEEKEGIDGTDGTDGTDGENGYNGQDGINGADGTSGIDGKAGIPGINGANGKNGIDGINGKDGKTAYASALEAGYQGTEEEFGIILSTTPAKIIELGIDMNTLNSSLANSVMQLNGSIDATNVRVEECFTSVSSGKSLLAATLTDKEIPTASDATFAVINESIHNLYTKGFADGVGSVNPNGTITYIRHNHTGDASSGGGCYTKAHSHTGACRPMCWVTELEFVTDCHGDSGNGGFDRTYYRCGACGLFCHNGGGLGGPGSRYHHPHQVVNPTCGLGGSFEANCGYQENQIISATIHYGKNANTLQTPVPYIMEQSIAEPVHQMIEQPPTESQTEPPTESQTETPTETQTETPTETPVETQTETQTEAAIQEDF